MDVKQQALGKVIKMLDNIGAQYAVVDFDGNKHGTLEVATPKTRTKHTEPWGEITAYLRGYIGEMKPGEVVEVPVKYGKKRTHSALSGYSCKLFGKGNCVTSYNEKKNIVQIIRMI